MLAYVFWHVARAGAIDYADRLERFHSGLKAEQPAGFIRSMVLRFLSLPWLPGSPVYEEWYLLENSAALDIMNDAAVRPPLKTSHDDVARDAAAGTAGIYELRRGEPRLSGVVWSHWFAKPVGMSYPALYREIENLTARPDVQLWSRYMVLGPTQEFCIHASEEVNLPDRFTFVTFRGELFSTVW